MKAILFRPVIFVTFLLGILLPLLVQPVYAAAGERESISLAGQWKKQYVVKAEDQPSGAWGAVTLPVLDNIPVDKEGLWYEREVTIPETWKDSCAIMHVFQCMYGIEVFVNGVLVGGIPAYGGELDITPGLKFGEKNTIRIFNGRQGNGLRAVDKVSQNLGDFFVQKDPGKSWLTAQIGIFGPADEFYLERRCKDAYISNAWYQTYTRGMQRIEPLVTIQAGRAMKGLTVKVVISDPGTKAVVREESFPLPLLLAGESEQRFVLNAAQLKLWGIREPNLYLGQVILLDGAGKEIDRSRPERFGIREFWAQGKDLYLNNKPVYFVSALNEPNVVPNIQKLFNRGATFISTCIPWYARFMNEVHTPEAVECDRLGIACTPPGVVCHYLNLSEPEVQSDYALWAKANAQKYQNNPSVVMYGIGINSPGNYLNFLPTNIGRAANLDWSNINNTVSYQISKRVDPTRLYYFHGGPCGADLSSGNFYPNHIPTQEIEEWFSDWLSRGDRPFLTTECVPGPITVDYQRNDVALATEYAAIKAGDAAYAAESEAYLAFAGFQQQRLDFWAMSLGTAPIIDQQREAARTRTMRAWRFDGVPFHNWDYFYVDIPDNGLRQPALCWLGGAPDQWAAKDHNYFAGDTVIKSAMVIRDLPGDDQWKFDWEVKVKGNATPIAKGSFTELVGQFARMKLPIKFTAPAVASPTEAEITLLATNVKTNKEIARDAFAITVYPSPAPPKVSSRVAPFAIFDPAGESVAWLKARGAEVAPFDAAKTRPKVLIIGRGALKGLKTLPFTAADVAAGMRVVIFEQHCTELGSMGLQHEDCCPRQVFPRQTLHPLAAGLTADGLRDWQGAGTLISAGPEGDRIPGSSRLAHWGNRGTVASAIIETPHFGPFLPILDCEFDLNYTPLMSWRHGVGEVIFCQLDLVGRVGKEPAATIAADNLIRYLRSPLPVQQVKEAVCLDEATCKMIDARGFAARVLNGKPDPARQIVIVTGEQTDLFAAKRQQLMDFVNAGGDLLVLYASGKLVADPAFGGAVKLEKVRVTRAGRTVDSSPLLAGVGPQNIHWRQPIDLLKVTSTTPKFTSLLGGLLGVQPQGKGRIILFQIDPKQMNDYTAMKEADAAWLAKSGWANNKDLPDSWLKLDRMRSNWQVARLNSLLLANLNVQSSAALTHRLFDLKRSMPFAPVNAWAIFGPVSPPEGAETDAGTDPLDRKDYAELASHRDQDYRALNKRKETMRWIFPTDSNNGMGLDGKVDLAKIFGVRLREMAVAVTYVWSARERDAVIGTGADWWMRLDVNGKEVARSTVPPTQFAINFDNKITVNLKQGWNELVYYVIAGSNGHVFWFEISNPGDVVVAQQLTMPTAPPPNIPPAEELIPDSVDNGFSLYTEEVSSPDDPYGYVPW